MCTVWMECMCAVWMGCMWAREGRLHCRVVQGRGLLQTIFSGNAVTVSNVDGVTVVTQQRSALPGSNTGNDGNEGDEGSSRSNLFTITGQTGLNNNGDEGNEGDEGDEGDEGGNAGSTSGGSISGSGGCASSSALMQDMVALDNQQRAQRGISQLACDSLLEAVAYEWSKKQCSCEPPPPPPFPLPRCRIVPSALRSELCIMVASLGGRTAADGIHRSFMHEPAGSRRVAALTS